MPIDFAAWYQPAMLVPDTELLSKRSQATITLAKKITVREVLDLVRLAFALGKVDSDLNQLMAPYREVDSTFVVDLRQNAVSVLAGCVLATLMDTRHSTGSAAALAILSASACFDRKPAHHSQLTQLAQRYVEDAPALVQVKGAKPIVTYGPVKVGDSLSALAPDADAAKVANAVRLALPIVAESIKATTTLGADVGKQFASQNHQLAYQQQQIDMLWWLLGEWCDALSAPYPNLATSAACLIAPHELASLTTSETGPRAVQAMIHKTLLITKNGAKDTLTLVDAVNSCPRTWREQVAKSPFTGIAREICPVSLAVSDSLATDANDTWVPVFEKSSGLKKQKKFSAMDLALQTYREKLLEKLMS